jgi:hypothetical protein
MSLTNTSKSECRDYHWQKVIWYSNDWATSWKNVVFHKSLSVGVGTFVPIARYQDHTTLDNNCDFDNWVAAHLYTKKKVQVLKVR